LEYLDHDGRRQYAQRIEQYMQKALREAKHHTSWLHPDEEYEQRVFDFLRAVLGEQTQDAFLEDLDLFVRSISDAGFANSLGQVVLKVCSPGVPDFYQGTELWDFNLVDPDNRRPVDFSHRKELLAELQACATDDLASLVEDLVAEWPDERIKLFTVWRALAARRQDPDLFLQGRYLPLTAEGPQSEQVCAFAREHQGRWLVAVAPRLSLARLRQPVLVGEAEEEIGGGLALDPSESGRVGAPWRDTALSLPLDAPDRWRNVFTEERHTAQGLGDLELIDLADALGRFPVALLLGEE
jgi:(1->4)-alpha-D-glucan 1-alpha-D-glucosylmutase